MDRESSGDLRALVDLRHRDLSELRLDGKLRRIPWSLSGCNQSDSWKPRRRSPESVVASHEIWTWFHQLVQIRHPGLQPVLIFNPLNPQDALKHNFTSLKTDLIFLQLGFLKWIFPWNCFNNNDIFFSLASQLQVIFIHCKSRISLNTEIKWNKEGFMPPLCTCRLNWTKRTSWGWLDKWDDTALQTQNSKF